MKAGDRSAPSQDLKSLYARVRDDLFDSNSFNSDKASAANPMMTLLFDQLIKGGPPIPENSLISQLYGVRHRVKDKEEQKRDRKAFRTTLHRAQERLRSFRSLQGGRLFEVTICETDGVLALKVDESSGPPDTRGSVLRFWEPYFESADRPTYVLFVQPSKQTTDRNFGDSQAQIIRGGMSLVEMFLTHKKRCSWESVGNPWKSPPTSLWNGNLIVLVNSLEDLRGSQLWPSVATRHERVMFSRTSTKVSEWRAKVTKSSKPTIELGNFLQLDWNDATFPRERDSTKDRVALSVFQAADPCMLSAMLYYLSNETMLEKVLNALKTNKDVEDSEKHSTTPSDNLIDFGIRFSAVRDESQAWPQEFDPSELGVDVVMKRHIQDFGFDLDDWSDFMTGIT